MRNIVNRYRSKGNKKRHEGLINESIGKTSYKLKICPQDPCKRK